MSNASLSDFENYLTLRLEGQAGASLRESM